MTSLSRFVYNSREGLLLLARQWLINVGSLSEEQYLIYLFIYMRSSL